MTRTNSFLCQGFKIPLRSHDSLPRQPVPGVQRPVSVRGNDELTSDNVTWWPWPGEHRGAQVQDGGCWRGDEGGAAPRGGAHPHLAQHRGQAQAAAGGRGALRGQGGREVRRLAIWYPVQLTLTEIETGDCQFRKHSLFIIWKTKCNTFTHAPRTPTDRVAYDFAAISSFSNVDVYVKTSLSNWCVQSKNII